MTAASDPDAETARPGASPAPDPAGRAADDAAPAGSVRPDAPDPEEAAAPDDVIREPDDVPSDTTDGESGEAKHVAPSGEQEPIEAPPADGRKRAAFVYNPTKIDPDTAREAILRLSEQAGWAEPLLYETTVDDLGDDVTRQALSEGVDAVLVAGGDGTVRAVAEAMTESGVRLTIVPSGTGNLLARNLGLPLDNPEAMIRATFDGDVHGTDAGIAHVIRADGSSAEHGFVVMAGIGLDAAMIANTNPQLKKAVGWVAYVDGAARSLPAAKPFRVAYQLEGHRLHTAKVQSVLFANCGALPAGIALIPDASISDGILDVMVIQPSGPFGWFGVGRKVWWDNSVLRRFRAGRRVLERRGRDASIHYFRGTAAETATTSPQPVQLDGDEFGEAVRIHCRIIPSGLQLVVPKGHRVAVA